MEPNKDVLDLNNGVAFIFDENIGLPDPKVESVAILNGPHDWLKAMFKAKSKLHYKPIAEICKTIDPESVQIFADSIISNKMEYTHPGFIQYVFTAWVNELGVVLKPDVLFYTIISEIKDAIINKPDNFKKLFTTLDEKTEIEVVHLTIDKLVDALEQLIPCKELFDIITKTEFDTAPFYFKQVLGITMADMGTPYYSYSTSKCGIPKLRVLGDIGNWENLCRAIDGLQKLLAPCSSQVGKYLLLALETINEIMAAAFTKNDREFFQNIFTYAKNAKCGSGHAKVVMNGWIKNFYINHQSPYIRDYSSHLNCLPYIDKDDPSKIMYYFYASGLSSSYVIDGYLYPEYNIAHCQITHPDAKMIFDTMACNKN